MLILLQIPKLQVKPAGEKSEPCILLVNNMVSEWYPSGRPPFLAIVANEGLVRDPRA